MNDDSPAARRLALAKKLLLACGATIVALLAAETGYRIVLHVQGHDYSAKAARQEMANVVRSMLTRIPKVQGASNTGEVLPKSPASGFTDDVHPYLGFEPPEFLDIIAREVQYFDSQNAEANYDVVVLGGSVAVQFGMLANLRMTQLLQSDPRLAGRKVKCFGHGRAAFKQPQQVNLLSLLLSLGYRPDCVIELDGFNEMAMAHGNAAMGTNPLYPGAGQWGPLVRGTHLDRAVLDSMLDVRDHERRAQALADTWNGWGLFASAVAGRFGLSRAHRLRRETLALQERIVEGVNDADKRHVLRGPDFDPATVTEQAVRAWSEGSRSLDALCRERGILYIHALQPTLHDAGSKPLAPEEVRNGRSPDAWVDGVVRGYPRLREAGAELTRLGVNFIDCSMVFRERTEVIYFDGCHFNEDGHLLLADTIAPFVLKCLDAAPGFKPVAGAAVSGTASDPQSR